MPPWSHRAIHLARIHQDTDTQRESEHTGLLFEHGEDSRPGVSCPNRIGSFTDWGHR